MKYNGILAVFLLFAASPVLAAEVPVRSITLTGEASEQVAPDQAVLSGQIVTKDKQLAVAKQENDKMAQRVLDITKKFDIPKEKVAASNVYISPEYRYDQKTSRQELVGYMVSRSLTITMDKLDIHEQVLSALVEGGIDQVNGVSFGISKPEDRQNALRVKAVQNAHDRAALLAGAAGAKLGKVLSIALGGSYDGPVRPVMMKAAMADAGGSVAPSLPGMNTLQETVTVSYELE